MRQRYMTIEVEGSPNSFIERPEPPPLETQHVFLVDLHCKANRFLFYATPSPTTS